MLPSSLNPHVKHSSMSSPTCLTFLHGSTHLSIISLWFHPPLHPSFMTPPTRPPFFLDSQHLSSFHASTHLFTLPSWGHPSIHLFSMTPPTCPLFLQWLHPPVIPPFMSPPTSSSSLPDCTYLTDPRLHGQYLLYLLQNNIFMKPQWKTNEFKISLKQTNKKKYSYEVTFPWCLSIFTSHFLMFTQKQNPFCLFSR